MLKPLRKVWVITKRSRRSRRFFTGRISSDAAAFVRRDRKRLRMAQESHRRTLQTVLRLLRQRNLKIRLSARSRRWGRFPADLVISVGGDGTFLEAARGVRHELILGVNSDPQRSAGKFCAARAENFGRILERILRGKPRVRQLHRLQLLLNGSRLPMEVLNDLLITHRRPAAMSRYWIRIGNRREEQRSSGLWAATAVGSTGAIRSAGGRKLPIESRQIQYMPRELYESAGIRHRLRGGVIPAGAVLRVGSLMAQGMICADGEHQTFPFRYGDRLEIRRSGRPLRWVEG